MIDCMVQLTSVSEAKRFTNIACGQHFDICIVSGHSVVDAKSIMAVFSLDLSKPLRVEAECRQGEGADFLRAIKEFIITDTEV